MSKTIMIVGHPYWNDSVANKAIVEEFLRLNPDSTVSNIAELYPDGKLDVKAEQKKLLEADNIVLQFPIMWYSCPSDMHRWLEEVLAYGFAYGHGGDKLKGKRFIVSLTSGGTADMYSKYGVQKMTIDDLMPAFVGIPNHCGMQWSGYVFSGGMMTAGNTDEENSILLGRAKALAGTRQTIRPYITREPSPDKGNGSHCNIAAPGIYVAISDIEMLCMCRSRYSRQCPHGYGWSQSCRCQTPVSI